MGAGIGKLIWSVLGGFGGKAWDFVKRNWRPVVAVVAVVVAGIWIASLYGKVASRDADIREQAEEITRLEGAAVQFRAAIERGEQDRAALSSAVEEAKAATARAGSDVAKAFAICAKQIERLRLIDAAVARCPKDTSCPDGGAPVTPVDCDPLVDAANSLFTWGK